MDIKVLDTFAASSTLRTRVNVIRCEIAKFSNELELLPDADKEALAEEQKAIREIDAFFQGHADHIDQSLASLRVVMECICSSPGAGRG